MCTEARVAAAALFLLLSAGERVCFAQAQQSWCVPGTPLCVQGNGTGQGGVRVGAGAQGQVGPGGATGSANAGGNANANGNANAGGNANASGGGSASAGGNAAGDGSASGGGEGSASGGGDGQGGYSGPRRYYRSGRFGTGVALCGTVKGGIYSGIKGGPCFGVSFRTEPLTFEMETQLLIGGVRHSIDWVFPMSFVIPLTEEDSLYQGLQLRVGGSPIGVTFAKDEDGGTYLRFGLHAGLSYEWDFSSAVAWRVFDARAFLDFGTKREVDRRGNFMDFGGQLATGIVF